MSIPDWPKDGPALLQRMDSALRTRDGQLMIGGKTVRAWADQLGTPCFLYDRSLVNARIARLRAALPAQVRLHYAVKANPFEPLLAHLKERVDGFDTASLGELQALQRQGVDLHRCSIAGPAKSDNELIWAAENGVLVNLESAGEARRLAALARQAGIQARAALRLNPPFELKGSGMRMGGGSMPFGIDSEQAGAVLSELDRAALRLEGFHVYAGSQCRQADTLADGIERSLALVAKLSEQHGIMPRSINLGGGFGIPYAPNDEPLDLARLGGALRETLDRWRDRLPETEFVIELGRYLVGEAGIYVTRIVDRKHSRGR
ncbi:MAG: alanine racemase, partial [Halothiobacillaceae bacterium]